MESKSFVLKVWRLPIMSANDLVNLHDALTDVVVTHGRPILPRDCIFVIFPADRISVRDSDRALVEISTSVWIVSDNARKQLETAIEKAIDNFTAGLPISFRFVSGD